MLAGETGRIGIIQQAREAKTAITSRYKSVRDDIAAYLCDAARTPSTLAKLQNKYAALADDLTLTSWRREDARLSVDVLASLRRMENQLGGSRFIPAPARHSPLTLAGVTVSVRLDVLAVRERAGTTEFGGVLFRMTKSDDKTDNAARKRREIGLYAATLAMMQVQALAGADRVPHHQLCASFDIQCEDVHVAPRTFATRVKDMENACRFIAALWDRA